MSTLGELAKSYQDAWLADHQQAMACLDLEEKIALGSFLFELITKVDERYRLQVLQGQEEYREEFSRSVLELYRQWSSPCRKALEEIAAMQPCFGQRAVIHPSLPPVANPSPFIAG